MDGWMPSKSLTLTLTSRQIEDMNYNSGIRMPCIIMIEHLFSHRQENTQKFSAEAKL